jgi:hypothetical protein
MLLQALMDHSGKLDTKSSISHVPRMPLLLNLPAKTLGENVDAETILQVSAS